MIIEVLGVSEHNKGAVLMLEAIRAEIKRAFPSARLAVPGTMSPTARRALNVMAVLPERGGGLRTRVRRLLPRAIRQRLGFASVEDVSVLLDASGFGYGDFWGESKLERRLVNRLTGWRKSGRVAIMLPQALGPFDTGRMASLFGRAADLLDLIWVRDNVSLGHVQRVVRKPHVRRAPDFTNLLHPPLPAEHADLEGASLIITNEKMITGDRASQRTAYLAFLRMVAETLQRSGRHPALVVHEGEKDRRLADELNALLDFPLRVVDLPSPLDTKAVIGAAELIISSRFHGLVSALAAGVPALACGWSHKYNELMSDYGVQDASVSIAEPDRWQEALDSFLLDSQSAAYRQRLSEHAKAQRALSRSMWDETIAVINRR